MERFVIIISLLLFFSFFFCSHDLVQHLKRSRIFSPFFFVHFFQRKTPEKGGKQRSHFGINTNTFLLAPLYFLTFTLRIGANFLNNPRLKGNENLMDMRHAKTNTLFFLEANKFVLNRQRVPCWLQMMRHPDPKTNRRKKWMFLWGKARSYFLLHSNWYKSWLSFQVTIKSRHSLTFFC